MNNNNAIKINIYGKEVKYWANSISQTEIKRKLDLEEYYKKNLDINNLTG
jgi:hypothetical protein